MLREDELVGMRRDVALTMTSEAEILRSEPTRSPTGGQVQGPWLPVNVYPCRFGPASGSTRMVASKVQATQTAQVTLPWNAEVKTTDRIRVVNHLGDREEWEVEAVVDRDPDYHIVTKVVVSRQ